MLTSWRVTIRIGSGTLQGKLRPFGHDQKEVRPSQPVSHESEHQAVIAGFGHTSNLSEARQPRPALREGEDRPRASFVDFALFSAWKVRHRSMQWHRMGDAQLLVSRYHGK